MRAVLDACVLFPTVLREILLGAAAKGLYEPLWSERLLGEWVRATARLGPEAPLIAAGEAVQARVAFPKALVPPDAALEARLWLPDPADVHVLVAAIKGHADTIVTFNAEDFPRPILADHGLRRDDPDTFLLSLHDRAPTLIAALVEEVRARAEALSGQPQPMKPLLKRARLNRLAKVLAQG